MQQFTRVLTLPEYLSSNSHSPVMTVNLMCLEDLNSSWMFGLAAWAAFMLGLSLGFLTFASLEARKTKYKKYPESLSDFEEDSKNIEEEPTSLIFMRPCQMNIK